MSFLKARDRIKHNCNSISGFVKKKKVTFSFPSKFDKEIQRFADEIRDIDVKNLDPVKSSSNKYLDALNLCKRVDLKRDSDYITPNPRYGIKKGDNKSVNKKVKSKKRHNKTRKSKKKDKGKEKEKSKKKDKDGAKHDDTKRKHKSDGKRDKGRDDKTRHSKRHEGELEDDEDMHRGDGDYKFDQQPIKDKNGNEERVIPGGRGADSPLGGPSTMALIVGFVMFSVLLSSLVFVRIITWYQCETTE